MRYLRVRNYLSELLDAFPVDVVAYEEIRRHMGVDAAHVYGGIVAVLSSVCEAGGVPYSGVPVGTVKKQATGKGNASKDAMIATADARWTCSVADDNEADALWIAETLRVQVLGGAE